MDADLLERFPSILPSEPVIMYFGKFLNTKGVGEVLVSFVHVLLLNKWAILTLLSSTNVVKRQTNHKSCI